MDEFTLQAAYSTLKADIQISMGMGGNDVNVYTANQVSLAHDRGLCGRSSH
ncbi:MULTISPECIES: hypothetical protein [unclassified Paraburkholderia]|uniref:hypothetical protein n=1 Tax=unclassified Paraburkholderia TaxID=2615204 RepID=UPI002AB29098|nr:MULTISPECIES: hypothetical protein [unclassified Paraburkholderia]